MLWDIEICSVEYTPRQSYSIAYILECCHQFIEKVPMEPEGKPLYIFEGKSSGIQFSDQPYKL